MMRHRRLRRQGSHQQTDQFHQDQGDGWHRMPRVVAPSESQGLTAEPHAWKNDERQIKTVFTTILDKSPVVVQPTDHFIKTASVFALLKRRNFTIRLVA